MKIISLRFELINEILNILGETSSCYGTFLRNFFEYKYHNQFYDNNNIDFYYINKKEGFFDSKLIDKFKTYIDYFYSNKNIKSYEILNVAYINDARIFKDDKSTTNQERIPIYKITLLNNNLDFIFINILCWKPKFLGEFSVDCIEYNNKGFYSGDDKYIINDLLEQYRIRTTYFNKNLLFIQNLAFPVVPIPRNRKVKFLSLIYNNIIKKIIPFIDENIINYNIKGCYPILSNEKFEDCPITAIEPPYINLMLECQHKISIEAYKGIIFSKYDNSESIRCPYCRNDLKLKFYK